MLKRMDQIAYTSPSDPNVLRIGRDSKGSLIVGIGLCALGLLAGIQSFFSPVDNFFIGSFGCAFIGFIAFASGFFLIDELSWTTLDRKKMLLIKKKERFEAPTQVSIKSASQVLVKMEKRIIGGGEFDDVVTIYGVKIYTGQTCDFFETIHYEIARKTAKQLACFLNLPLVDLTFGSKAVPEHPQSFNLSLTDRIKQNGSIQVPDRPKQLKSKISRQGRQVCFDIPARGITPVVCSWLWALSVIMVTAMSLIVFYDFHHPMDMNDRYWIYGPWAVIFVGLPVLMAVRIIKLACVIPIRFKAGPLGVTLEEQRFFRNRKRFIKSADLQQLKAYLPSTTQKYSYQPSSYGKTVWPSGFRKAPRAHRIRAISEGLAMEFGQGLSFEELEYIAAVSVKALI